MGPIESRSRISAILFCSLIMISINRAYGIGGRLFAPTKPVVENLLDCTSSVQEGVTLARSTSSWGTFSIECAAGKATRMSTPKLSPIFLNWPKFVRSYPEIFGVDRNEVIEQSHPWNGHVTMGQIWKGFKVNSSIGRIISWGEHSGVIMDIESADTKNWGPEPRINSETASRIVSAVWEKKNRQIKRSIPGGLALYSGKMGCGSPESPRVVWDIYVEAEKETSAQICYVDVTGHICGPCNTAP